MAMSTLFHADQAKARAARSALARRGHVEAAPIVAHRKREVSTTVEEPHPQIMGMRVPQHIVDCFLRDAKTSRFGIRLELVRRIAGIEVRRELGHAGLAVEMRAQRRGEP